MTGHGSDEPPLEILKETKEPWEVRLDKLRAAESDAFLGREDAKRLRAQKAALMDALEKGVWLYEHGGPRNSNDFADAFNEWADGEARTAIAAAKGD